MTGTDKSVLHDGYAAGYDAEVVAHDCYVADLLFGLCHEYIRPGQRLLDMGIGSGLSSQPFAKAGLQIYGMDFSPAMIDICRAKSFAVELRRHDIEEFPWPYPSGSFDHAVCCGVLHFIAGPDGIFAEAARVLSPGGIFAFTTKAPSTGTPRHAEFERAVAGEFEIFSHSAARVEALLDQCGFDRRKSQRAYVADDLFILWVAARRRQ